MSLVTENRVWIKNGGLIRLLTRTKTNLDRLLLVLTEKGEVKLLPFRHPSLTVIPISHHVPGLVLMKWADDLAARNEEREY